MRKQLRTCGHWLRHAAHPYAPSLPAPHASAPGPAPRLSVAHCLADCSQLDRRCCPGCLQVTLGTLLPLAALWAVEDRQRGRALQAWLKEPQQEREQRQEQQQQCATAGASVGPAHAGEAGPGRPGRLPRPLGLASLAAWCVGTAWILWLALEATLL